ncbi:hypothetical protein HYT51_03005, partial [Candidatus Woesearchaeota archaeon]|nr:hypothetical protein [Candidatus Woesearchaeota archaeon]
MARKTDQKTVDQIVRYIYEHFQLDDRVRLLGKEARKAKNLGDADNAKKLYEEAIGLCTD